MGMICVDSKDYDIMVVSEKGYGKRSDLDDYRETNRGGKGVKTISITEKTGDLIAIKNVKDTDDLMLIKKSGVILRMAVKDLRVVGRNTQGVRLIKLKDSDAIASVTQVPAEEEDDNLNESFNSIDGENVEIIEENDNVEIIDNEDSENETEENNQE